MPRKRREYLIRMKNKYLTKCLCLSLISTMVTSGAATVSAAEVTDTFTSENTSGDSSGQAFSAAEVSTPPAAPVQEPVVPSDTPVSVPDAGTSSENQTTPEPSAPASGEDTAPVQGDEGTPAPDPGVTPTPGEGENVTPAPDPGVTPTPGEGENVTPTPDPGVTPTPGEGENVTPTPDPGVTPTPGEGENVTPTPDPGVTPTPGEGENVTPTPVPLTERAKAVYDGINALAGVELTLDHEAEVIRLREGYDSLADDEKAAVTNYSLLVGYEARIQELKGDAFSDSDLADITDGINGVVFPDAIVGSPVYYTNMVSNIHAGKEFYLNSLKNNYQLTFSDDFASVMDEIEKEYKAKNKLTDASDSRTDGVTTSADTLLVRNWQDILAIYVYEKSLDGAKSFVLDASCKEDLAVIFEEMNPVVRDKENITHVSYGNRHINYYIKKNDIKKEDRQILKKYVETDCKLLCATVTAAKGFVRQSVGDDVSEERVNVIAAAYSLVGKVGYFWGGKSSVLGMDPSWGTAARVTSAGSHSTGTIRSYGLDCSGFVTWSVINGYQNQGMQAAVGDGTSEQWCLAQVVSEENAQPGDLVFQRGPEAGSDNHVGIICGKTDAGDWIAVHCSSSKNGVTVGEAYGASFRYIRRPSFYPTDAQVAQMAAGEISDGDDTIFVSNFLQNVISQYRTDKGNDSNILNDIPVFNSESDIEVFTGM